MTGYGEPYNKQLTRISDDVYYYVIDSNIINSGYNTIELLDMLSTEEKSKYYRYRLDQDKKMFLCSRIVLRNEFKSKFGIPFNQKISFNKYKKPLLTDFPDIHFNISHSSNYVMLGFSDYPIGIDIERILYFSKSELTNFAKIVFHKSELDLISLHNEYDAQRIFFKIWTIKESFIKSIGKGFNYNTKSFSISHINSDNPKINLNGYENTGVHFKMLNDNLAISACYNYN